MPPSLTPKKLKTYLGTLDLEALGNLPPPGQFFAGKSINVLQDLTCYLFTACHKLTTDSSFERSTAEIQWRHSPTATKFVGEEAVEWVAISLALYYHFALMRILESVGLKASAAPPGFDLNLLMEMAEKAEEAESSSVLSGARVAIYNYLYAAIGAFGICSTRVHGHTNSLLTSLESTVHGALYRLIESAKPGEDNSTLGIWRWSLVRCCAELIDMSYWIAAHRQAPSNSIPRFIDIRLAELPLLATRNEVVVDRYGAANVSSEFESQVSLLFQSLGFYTTRPGKGVAAIDLICISDQVDPPRVMVVDAKSSEHPYQLPKDDIRAFQDYIAHLRGSLSTLPRVTDLLIVGGSSAPSLPGRLKDLEATTGVLARFVGADHLADLRHRIVGTLRHSDFFDMLKTANYVVECGHIEKVDELSKGRATAVGEMVSAFTGQPWRSA